MATYQILSPLGSGGSGTVYVARQDPMGRHVALKILTRLGDDPVAVERFLREMKVLSALAHPRIVRIYDSGRHDGRPYFAMELVDGLTVAALASDDPARARALADAILAQLLEALAYLHESGVVHRDIKASNVMLDRSDAVRVVDFGLAKLLDSPAPNLTEKDVIVGTLEYMAPERFRDATGSFAADVWAAGCLYYRLLAGRPAFGGETAADVCHAVLEGDPAPVPLLDPVVDGRRAALVARLLERDLRRRPADGRAALAAMRELLETDASRPVTSPAHAPDAITAPIELPRARAGKAPARRTGRLAWPAGITACALLACTWAWRGDHRQSAPPAVPATPPADPAGASPGAEPLDQALFRLRPGALARQLCAGRGRAHPTPRMDDVPAAIQAASAQSGIARALAAAPAEDAGLSGSSPRGIARYERLSDLQLLTDMLWAAELPLRLPAARGWPRDLAPLAEAPAGVSASASVTFDREPVRFWVAGSAPKDLAEPWKPIARARTTYRHPGPLALRAPAPDEDVVLDLDVKHLSPAEQLVVSLSAGGEVIVNGRDSRRMHLYHRIPRSFLGRLELSLEYRYCENLGVSGDAEVYAVALLLVRADSAKR